MKKTTIASVLSLLKNAAIAILSVLFLIACGAAVLAYHVAKGAWNGAKSGVRALKAGYLPRRRSAAPVQGAAA